MALRGDALGADGMVGAVHARSRAGISNRQSARTGDHIRATGIIDVGY
jgi:hypothetical protein